MKPIPAKLALMLPFMLYATGCSQPVHKGDAATDAAAVALVENAQKLHPDPVVLIPQPLALGEIAANELTGHGCEFRLQSAWMDYPIAVAGGEKGAVKLRGEIVTLAADSGSAEFPFAAREKYVGRTLSLRLTKGPGKGTPVGNESVEWPGSLTLSDRYERTVYFAPGTVLCGA